MIADNLASVRQRIATCCARIGRSPDEVTLVCVTKGAPVPSITAAIQAGVADIGENRVQEACEKYRQIGARVRWHLVGHLQTNKVKDAVRISSLIHSVDSVRLALAIDKEAGKIGKRQDVLIQVNTSREETKFGCSPEDALSLVRTTSCYPHLAVQGFMTIAPEVEDRERIRSCFKTLKQLLDNVNALRLTHYELRILSMGMTDDFEVAIEEGATMVRIGRAIFREE